MTANPLVAARVSQPDERWAGVWIAEDIELIAQGVRSGSWVDGSLGVVGAGLDGLALVSDPVGTLLQYGVSWIIEHVRPLSQALDWLAGDPGQIAGNARTWRNVSSSLASQADALGREVAVDVPDWRGAAAAAYRDWSGRQEAAIRALAGAADTMAAVTEGAGFLIAAVRMLVRDAIATCVSRLAVYAAEEVFSLGLATPLVVEQVATLVASWAAKIARWLRALLASLRELVPVVRRLGELIEELKKILTRLRGGDPLSGQGESPSGIPGSELPDFRHPEIDPQKVTGYAMNPDHPVGKNKYRVINSATGLGPADAAAIEQQIREQVRTGEPMLGRADQYGQRWAVDVVLSGPRGEITVRTAWIIATGSTTPRLVTISFP